MKQISKYFEYTEDQVMEDIRVTRKVYYSVKDIQDAKSFKQANKIVIELEDKINKQTLGNMFMLYELELKELAHKAMLGSPCYKLQDFNYTLHCLIRSLAETIQVKSELLQS